MSEQFSEDVVEQATLTWLEELGYQRAYGPDIAPGERDAERAAYQDVILGDRLRRALAQLNPDAETDAIDEVVRKLLLISSPLLVDANHQFHHYLVNGITIEFLRADGSTGSAPLRLLDHDDPDNNDWLVVNQFTVREADHTRRPDVMVFVNGLPLGIIELKNTTNERATVWHAHKQLQTYKRELPALFTFNEVMVISDGLDARIGTLSSPQERFMPWRTIEGEKLAPASKTKLEVLLRGVFERQRFLDLIRSFVVFEDDGDEVVKKMAAYHQFHAVQSAVAATLTSANPEGDQRVGVVWHTQGSGKSLTMAFYAGKVVLAPEMNNPTLVVLTDRNDLDDQLFSTFAGCHELLRQKPIQAQDRDDLRDRLKVASGGVVFTTIQKFMPKVKGDSYPLLSQRCNIVVIADEAHRSQYDFIDGYARHMRDALPNASFIGFTGTPIELGDKSTRAIFGHDISIYDIQRAVEDGATVPIYYESRLARISLDDEVKAELDENIEDITEGEEAATAEKLKTKWSALEALVGADERLNLIERPPHHGDRA